MTMTHAPSFPSPDLSDKSCRLSTRKPFWLTWSAALLISFVPLAAQADSDRHRHKHGREYKDVYWDGDCKVERKWKRNGQYQEKRKCGGHRPRYMVPQPAYPIIDAPAIIIAPPPIIIRP